MNNTLHIAQYRPMPRERKTALLYVMRPTSTITEPVWDLIRVFTAFNSDRFDLPQNDGLYYMVMDPTGKVLVSTIPK